MTVRFDIRPARKSDAAEVALLVNIAVHGGTARMWANDDDAEGTYDPIEVGRLEMMKGDPEFGWEGATMAEADGEVVGMILGFRKPDAFKPVPPTVTGYLRPIEELEAEANGRWFINMVGVHKRWRGRGAGSALLDVAEAKARESAAHGQALIVEDVNEDAQRLYRRHGFSVGAQRSMIPFPDGHRPGRDWLLMVKD